MEAEPGQELPLLLRVSTTAAYDAVYSGTYIPEGPPALGSEPLAGMHYQRRRETVQFSSEASLRGAAAMHRRIYQAIRAHDCEAARAAMDEHLLPAGTEQTQEPRTTG